MFLTSLGIVEQNSLCSHFRRHNNSPKVAICLGEPTGLSLNFIINQGIFLWKKKGALKRTICKKRRIIVRIKMLLLLCSPQHLIRFSWSIYWIRIYFYFGVLNSFFLLYFPLSFPLKVVENNIYYLFIT